MTCRDITVSVKILTVQIRTGPWLYTQSQIIILVVQEVEYTTYKEGYQKLSHISNNIPATAFLNYFFFLCYIIKRKVSKYRKTVINTMSERKDMVGFG